MVRLSFVKAWVLSLLCAAASVEHCRASDGDNYSNNKVMIAGLYDVKGFPWAEELIQFTVNLLNDKTDGYFDDVLMGTTTLEYSITDVACDEDTAVRALLNLTEVNSPHAILGGRCSGPTKDMARLASVMGIPIVSPSATSAKLNDTSAYSTFSRLVGPDDKTGQVGVLVSLLRSFDWDRINIIYTDTSYASDFEIELRSAWEGKHEGDDGNFIGEIPYSGRVKISSKTGQLNPDTVRQVLKNVQANKPEINSKVIVLLGHHRHSYEILKIAQEEKEFAKDTIWVGASAWIGRPTSPTDDASWMPSIPGYIGVTPFRNTTAPVYKDFLGRLQAEQRRQNRTVWTDLPDTAADRMVDSILALAMAFSHVKPEQRHDGDAVVAALRNITFEGLSGWVEFNSNGELAAPKCSIMMLPKNGTEWEVIGYGVPGKVHVDHSKICWAGIGCVDYIPREKLDVPPDIMLIGFASSLGLFACSFCLVSVAFKIDRDRRLPSKERLRKLEEELAQLESNDDAAKDKKARLYKDIARLLGQPRPEHWTDEEGLVQVAPTQKEYWDIHDHLDASMDEGEPVWISRLLRNQNDGLLSNYVFHWNKLANKYGVDLEDIRECYCWHGTSSLNPEVICTDMQDGFMRQFSQDGLYGRGIYFAERSGYSDSYSHRVNGWVGNVTHQEREQNDREMILVKLLVGKNIVLDHTESIAMAEMCKSIVIPPENPTDGLKFDTVTGRSVCGTIIHVVYDNGRAFPQYIVRYYKGPRDPSRTPFRSYEDAQAVAENGTSLTMSISDSGDGSSTSCGDNIGHVEPTRSVSNGHGGSSSSSISSDEVLDLEIGTPQTTTPPVPVPHHPPPFVPPRQTRAAPIIIRNSYNNDVQLGGDTLEQQHQFEAVTRSTAAPSAPAPAPAPTTPPEQWAAGRLEMAVPIVTVNETDDDDPHAGHHAHWLYEGDYGVFESYGDNLQLRLEEAYQRNPLGRVRFEQYPWMYEVDFDAETQTNLHHPDGRIRQIRRIF